MEEFCGSEFWTANSTWNTTDHPDFTPCFEKTTLVWIPCFYLWVFSIFYIISIKHSKNRLVPWSWINISKIVCSIVLLLTEGGLLLANIVTSDTNINGVDYLYPSLLFATILLQLVFVLLGKKYGFQTSGFLFGFWLLLLVCGLPSYRSNFLHVQEKGQSAEFITYMIYYPFVVFMFFLNCFADRKPEFEFYPRGKNPTPEIGASFPSQIVFAWYDSLVWKGYRTPLKQEDLWDLPYYNASRYVVKKWDKDFEIYEKNFKRSEQRKRDKYSEKKLKTSNDSSSPNKDKQMSLFPTLFRTFRFEILIAAILKFFHDMLQFASPQIIKLLIFFAATTNQSAWVGYLYAVALFVVTELQSLLLAQQFLIMYTIGLRIRTAVTSVVYRKALRVSSSSKKESTVGEIVNLMAVDVQRFMDLMGYINMVWSAPLQIILCIYFLWQILGVSAFVGLLVMVVLIPINGIIANRQKIYQIIQMKEKDKRVKMMNEILNGIKVLKLYAWEPSFIDQVMGVRKKEIKVLKSSAYLGAATSFVFTCTPFMVSFFMFMTYVLISPDNILTPDIVFVSLSLLNIMRMPMTLLPMLIIALVQASVSLKRMNKFFNSEELDPNAVERNPKEDDPIVIKNGSFSWDCRDVNCVTLRNINIRIKKGSLVGVVGTVGAGKSSLCSAILGEMDKLNGRVNVNQSVAYVPQQAWIQNATLEDNILFSQPSKEFFYKKVVEACALKSDFEMLPAGDQTEIGEKGINLSGGQKQRVSLARAVYADAEIYLLDDPLAAVDSHVGKHIFEQVIGPQGMLKGKTRLLVTHGIHYIRNMDLVVVLKQGEVSEIGTFNELIANKGAFQEFLLQHLLQEDEIEEDLDIVEEIKTELEKAMGKKVLERQLSQISNKRHESETSDEIKSGSLRRRGSKKSVSSLRSIKSKSESIIPQVKPGEKLMSVEQAETGGVSYKVYSYYARAIGLISAVFTVIFYSSGQAFSVLGNILLSKWSDNPNGAEPSVRNKYLGTYAAFGIGQALSILFAYTILARAAMYGSRKLHNEMLKNILRSPMSFFDMTPIGRIVNRFSKDIDIIDVLLPMNIRSFLLCFTTVIFTFIAIVYATKQFVYVLIPAMVVYFFIQNIYVTTSRQLKRIESVTRSPIYTHFGESIQGSVTIRAYGRQEDFILQSEAKVDYNQLSYYPNIVSYRWLSVRLEFIGNVLTFFAAFFTVISRENVSGGQVGLSLSYALSVTQILNFLVRMTSDVETNIVSVERIKEYSGTPQEAPWDIPEHKPPKEWPDKGVVRFDKYSTRYREGLDLVIKDIDCLIEASEKIGIVGRTGAGKSSMTLALFRIIEGAAGKILIDDVDISQIGLHDLREKITIIPQDPVLFSGTLRMNLDPFDTCSDDVLWNALENSYLKDFVSTLELKLGHEISEGGENLSVGQRQLVCLTRALLRKTKVLVLDEATAAIDLETDELIQATIREQFADSTVITIAHRLNTIMDSTRVLILDRGEIKEFDTPTNLLQDNKSLFYGMAKDAGLV